MSRNQTWCTPKEELLPPLQEGECHPEGKFLRRYVCKRLLALGGGEIASLMARWRLAHKEEQKLWQCSISTSSTSGPQAVSQARPIEVELTNKTASG